MSAYCGWLIALSAVMLGLSMNVRDGLYSIDAMVYFTVALVMALAAAADAGQSQDMCHWRLDRQFPAPDSTKQSTSTVHMDHWLAGAIVLGVGALALGTPFSMPKAPGDSDVWYALRWDLKLQFFGVYAAGAACVWAIATQAAKHQLYAFVALVLVNLIGASMTIRYDYRPFIDVWHVTQESCAALSNGLNPYSIQLTDIYEGGTTYPPGYSEQVVDPATGETKWVINCGWLYPPLTLYLSWLGYATLQEFRYANMVAIALTGVVVALCGWRRAESLPRRALLAGAIVLLTPRVFLMVDMGWNEAWTGLLLACTIFVARFCPRYVWLPLGLTLATKQHLVLLLPLLPLLVERGVWTQLLLSVAVAAGVSAPMILSDINGFIRSNLLLRMGVPLRADSVSYLAMFNQVLYGGSTTSDRFPSQLGNLPGLAAYAFAVEFCLKRLRRFAGNPARFAFAVGLTLMIMFAFSRQAFVNYYYLTIVAFAAASAVSSTTKENQRD